MDSKPQGIDSEQLVERLRRCRVNDVYVEVTDAEPEEPLRFRAHGARYDPTSDTVVILAHMHYR